MVLIFESHFESNQSKLKLFLFLFRFNYKSFSVYFLYKNLHFFYQPQTTVETATTSETERFGRNKKKALLRSFCARCSCTDVNKIRYNDNTGFLLGKVGWLPILDFGKSCELDKNDK
uniref:Uncharacterized protein n=1 Tax=Cacopsylla melanoneura TaxID=428564 RepID=A0A8D8R617_9HEMI